MIQHTDAELLRAAVLGWKTTVQHLQQRIIETEAVLSNGTPATAPPLATVRDIKQATRVAARAFAPPKKPKFSAAARKRIADAQRKRWADFHAKLAKAKAKK